MKQGGWIPIDKTLRHYLPKGRAYTLIEAYISYRIDLDEGRPWTVNGYSSLWGWDRKRVRRFTSELGTSSGQFRDTVGTPLAHMIRNVFNNIEEGRDTLGTGSGQGRDSSGDTTIKPNPKPEDKDSSPPPPEEVAGGEDDKKVAPVFSEAVMWIANDLARLVLLKNSKNRELQESKKEATVLRWAKDIDKMIRLDKREPREIAEVVRWCQKDPFWSQNILSGLKLREQYDKLILKMKGTVLAVVPAKPAKETRLDRNVQAVIDAGRMLGVLDDDKE